jgi:hypothetical protein
MKIVVCIKQVPDTTEIRLDPVTGTLIRDGVPSIMNPDDKAGLEMALELKDQYGAHVTVITMGPPQADDILREAFAMGADRAIHLSDRKFAGADTLATSNAIAGALHKLGLGFLDLEASFYIKVGSLLFVALVLLAFLGLMEVLSQQFLALLFSHYTFFLKCFLLYIL